MRYGYFDDDAREYVIERPDTPRSWSNYLGSTEYGAVITNNAGGYSFYKSAAQGRFLRLRFNSVPMDQPGRYLYLHDRDSGDYWSTSWQPVGKPLDQYTTTCRHGTGYTAIDSTYSGIRSECTYFVPLGRDFECWVVRITNESDRPRRLRGFTYVEYASNWNTTQDLVNLQYSQYIVKMDVVDGILRHAINDHLPPDPDDFTNNDQGRWTFMGLVGATPSGYDTDRETFLGPYRTYANPRVVEAGECTGSLAMGDNACGTLQVELDLAPGETKQFMVVLGIGKAETVGKQVLGEFNSIDRAMEALEELKRHWHAQLESIHCRTPDGQFDSMVNVWNAYNRLITYRWSRAASLVYNGERDGLGYRDTVQDIVSAVSAIPEDARQRLEMMISGQYSSGGAMPVVRPFAHRPGTEPLPDDLMEYRADDCMWLFNAVPAYVKETGDPAFFDRVLPYADAGKATVFEHLRRAIEFNFAHTGEHGLPCGLQADWNDCIEFGETGESVFVAFQLRQALLTCLDLCERLDRPDTVDWAKQRLSELDAAIEAFAWDGGWFRRGTMKDGSVIGTAEAEEGRIFLNAQSWAVLSGFASGERAKQAMDAVHEQLATEYGLMVCAPPFEKASVETIRAVLMNPGHKENGGIFSHTQGWAVMAEAMLGRGDRAWAYYRAYMPAAQNEIAEVREIEPYVHCQSTHSRFSRRFGASRIPWLSGTATWSYIAATQAILGLQPDYDGLRLDPCIPADWPGFTARRRFRGATYEIDVRNPDGLCRGVQGLTVDGTTVDGNLIPLAEPGRTTKVEATLEG